MKRIGLLTGGGDAPGLNAAIKSVVYRANDFDLDTVGILDGWQGLLDGRSGVVALEGDDYRGLRSRIGARVKDLDERSHFSARELRRLRSRWR